MKFPRSWCKHYAGMHKGDTCKAGVRFDSLPGYGVKGFMDACPCFAKCGTCEKAEYPTAEELRLAKEEMDRRFAATIKAREAIVAACGGPWKRGKAGSQGTIDCPVCQQSQALRFSRSGYNGHIHAACQTEGCVAWME